MKGPTPEPSELSQGARKLRVIIEEMKTTYTPIIHTSKKSFVKPRGDPSSRCEMIILRNNRHGEIIRVLWEYLRPLYGIKESVKFSQKIPHLTSTVRWLLSDRLLRGREPISASNVAT